MNLTPESESRGFVSSFEEEEYEVAKFLNMSNGPEDDDDDEDDEEEEDDDITEEGDMLDFPENDKEIFEDDEDEAYIRDYF